MLLLIVVEDLWHLNLAAAVAAVGVMLNFDVGFIKIAFVRQLEADVLDGQATFEPLHLVVSLYLKNVVGKAAGIEVAGVDNGVETIQACELAGVGVEKRTVGFEMDESAWNQNLAVVVKEPGAS